MNLSDAVAFGILKHAGFGDLMNRWAKGMQAPEDPSMRSGSRAMSQPISFGDAMLDTGKQIVGRSYNKAKDFASSVGPWGTAYAAPRSKEPSKIVGAEHKPKKDTSMTENWLNREQEYSIDIPGRGKVPISTLKEEALRTPATSEGRLQQWNNQQARQRRNRGY